MAAPASPTRWADDETDGERVTEEVAEVVVRLPLPPLSEAAKPPPNDEASSSLKTRARTGRVRTRGRGGSRQRTGSSGGDDEREPDRRSWEGGVRGALRHASTEVGPDALAEAGLPGDLESLLDARMLNEWREAGVSAERLRPHLAHAVAVVRRSGRPVVKPSAWLHAHGSQLAPTSAPTRTPVSAASPRPSQARPESGGDACANYGPFAYGWETARAHAATGEFELLAHIAAQANGFLDGLYGRVMLAQSPAYVGAFHSAVSLLPVIPDKVASVRLDELRNAGILALVEHVREAARVAVHAFDGSRD